MAEYEVRRRETVVRRTPDVEEVEVQRDPVLQTQRQVVEDPSASGRVLVSRIAGIIWLLFGALDALILVRVILKLIAANPSSSFASFVYNLSGVFLAPFSNLVASPVIGTGVVELSSMIAIVVYALLAWIVVRLFRLVFTPARTRENITTYRRDY